MATVIAATATADDRAHWMQRCGLDTACTNPVFTRPNRMNQQSRVQGAGICMDDGLAYTTRGASFGSEWHYAPKLALCREEADVMPRVLAVPADRPFEAGEGEPLKFCVVPHHGCGATVVYRAFRNGRSSRGQNIEQFIAVYDSRGRLTDCMTMGMEMGDDSDNDLRLALLAEPHAAYTVPQNMGSHDVAFDDDGNGFTVSRYWYLKDTGDGVPRKVDMKRHYAVTPEGRLVPGQPVAADGGALLADVAAAAAVTVYELLHAPMSDASALSRLEAVTPAALANPRLHDMLVHVAMMHFFRDPAAYVERAYARRTVSAPGLTRLLKEAAALSADRGIPYAHVLPRAVGECAAPPAAKRYALRALEAAGSAVSSPSPS